jgi:GNAT superfamily N-acetyltransferase
VSEPVTEPHQPILRDLGGGLVLRRASEQDIEPLIAFFSRIFSPRAGHEVRAVISGAWPVGSLEQFTLVEDTATGQIVSSLTLLSHTCTYAGIPFGVGRPEFVATDPAYRRRGLIRAQMETIHAWSEARGDKMQVIGGISNYYRQFGYEYALEMDYRRIGFTSYVPRLKEGESEPYRIRPATPDDAPFVAQTYAASRRRYLISRIQDDSYWRCFAARSQSDDPARTLLRIIETPTGVPAGYLAYLPQLLGDHQIAVFEYELAPGVAWLPVSYSVLRHLCAAGEEIAQRENKTFGTFAFNVGSAHPVHEALHDLLPRTLDPYALYVRIPDLVGFVQHITPALERRLAESVMVGHTGELKISFYRSGLRLAFEQGKIAGVEPWQPTSEDGSEDDGMARFPDRTFLQLLLGYRSLEELEYAFKDCSHRSDEARALARALFPKQTSYLF